MDFEKMRRGIQRRDFAVRCEHCKRAEDEEEKPEEEKPEEEEERSDSPEEKEEKEEEEERNSEEEEREPESGESGAGDDDKKEEEERGFIVEGYATTFGAPYQLMRGCGEAVFERIEPTAFAGAEMRDVVLQYDHAGRVYARQSNGTLKLELDARGLKVRADLGGTAAGRSLYEEIRGGYTTKMSFAFTIEDSDFEELPEEEVLGFRTGSKDTYYLHTIRKIGRVYDVSAVSLPANENTAIVANSRQSTDNSVWGTARRDDARARLAFNIAYLLTANSLQTADCCRL